MQMPSDSSKAQNKLFSQHSPAGAAQLASAASTHRSLQLLDSVCKGLVQNQHAVGLGHPDHVHSAAVPAWPLKLQVPPTRLHQALCCLYTQPGCTVPV